MIIGGNWEQLPLLETARTMGLKILLTDGNANCPGRALADDFYQVDARDLNGQLLAAKNHQVAGVIADECDYSHYAAVYVAHAMGLPNDGLLPAQLTTNKAWMRDRVRHADVMQPRFFPCIELAQARHAVELIGLPVIIKPVDNRGAFGVNIVRTLEELEAAFLDALVNAHSRQVIVEALISGTHITVDGICDEQGIHHNLAIASKIILPGDRPVITEVMYPAQIDEALRDHIFLINQHVINALSIRSGFTHSEYIVDERNRCFLVETANRGGGVLTSAKILPYLTGAKLYQFMILMALGRPASLHLQPLAEAVLLTFFVFKNGVIKAIAGIDRINALAGVLHFQLLIKPGQRIDRPTNGPQRHGFAILKAADVAAVHKLRSSMLDLLEISYAD
jgi:biotin carboxylase